MPEIVVPVSELLKQQSSGDTLEVPLAALLAQQGERLAPSHAREVTPLTADEERRFQQWGRQNKIPDIDDPRSFYDYRGYWKETKGRPIRFGIDHFTDTYKQHGHPTFSVESKYSTGPTDGGRWEGEVFLAPDGRRVNMMDQRQAEPFLRGEPVPEPERLATMHGPSQPPVVAQTQPQAPSSPSSDSRVWNAKTGQWMSVPPLGQGVLDAPVEGVPQLGRGVRDLAASTTMVGGMPVVLDPRRATDAASDILEGGMKTAQPALIAGAVAAPVVTGAAVGAGMLAQKGTEAALQNADPSIRRFAGNVAAVGAGALAGAGVARGRGAVRQVAQDARAVRAVREADAAARNQGFENARPVNGERVTTQVLGEGQRALPPGEPATISVPWQQLAEPDPVLALVARNRPETTAAPAPVAVPQNEVAAPAAVPTPIPPNLDEFSARRMRMPSDLRDDLNLLLEERRWMRAVSTEGAKVRLEDGTEGVVVQAATDPVNGLGADGRVLVRHPYTSSRGEFLPNAERWYRATALEPAPTDAPSVGATVPESGTPPVPSVGEPTPLSPQDQEREALRVIEAAGYEVSAYHPTKGWLLDKVSVSDATRSRGGGRSGARAVQPQTQQALATLNALGEEVVAEAINAPSVGEPPIDQTPAGAQPRLPGDVGAVREQDIATPEFEVPFSLLSEAAPATSVQADLFASPLTIVSAEPTVPSEVSNVRPQSPDQAGRPDAIQAPADRGQVRSRGQASRQRPAAQAQGQADGPLTRPVEIELRRLEAEFDMFGFEPTTYTNVSDLTADARSALESELPAGQRFAGNNLLRTAGHAGTPIYDLVLAEAARQGYKGGFPRRVVLDALRDLIAGKPAKTKAQKAALAVAAKNATDQSLRLQVPREEFMTEAEREAEGLPPAAEEYSAWLDAQDYNSEIAELSTDELRQIQKELAALDPSELSESERAELENVAAELAKRDPVGAKREASMRRFAEKKKQKGR